MTVSRSESSVGTKVPRIRTAEVLGNECSVELKLFGPFISFVDLLFLAMKRKQKVHLPFPGRMSKKATKLGSISLILGFFRV